MDKLCDHYLYAGLSCIIFRLLYLFYLIITLSTLYLQDWSLLGKTARWPRPKALANVRSS